MKLGETNAQLLSHHNSFVMILNAALGGDGKKGGGGPPKPDVPDVTAGASSVEDAIARVNMMLNFG